MFIRPRMVSCAQRDDVRAQTLHSWRQTDWDGEVLVELDRGFHPEVAARIEDTWLRVIQAAADDPEARFSLLMEDDLLFNRFLRHNLQRWPPLVGIAGNPRDCPFYGSIYRCDQPMYWRHQGQRYFLAAPERAWGAQAILLSRATARHIVKHWPAGPEPQDLKMAALAAQIGLVHYHDPSLVQHRAVPSTWSPRSHQASDFDADFRAPRG
jgi:hypothetical protein